MATSEPGPMSNVVTRPLWLDQLDPFPPQREPLPGDIECDVAIVGGGYSGLWTAWYLRRLDPGIRIQIIERHHCGYGGVGSQRRMGGR